MAEAFAALGIAANIFQFLELGLKTTRSIVATYRSVDIDGLAQHTADLNLSASDFRKQCAQLKSDIEIAKDKSSIALLIRCVDTAKGINKEIGGLKIPKSKRGKTWSRIWFGLKASWKSSKIEGLQADLVEMRGEVCFGLQGLIYEHQKSQSKSLGSLGEVSKAWNTATTQKLDDMAKRIGGLLAAQEASATVADDTDRQYAELASALERFASEAKDHDFVRAILQSLHFAQIKERQNEIPVAHKNTFEWVFRDDSTTNFPAWLRGSNGLFWVTGKPGSGKSTLMKFIMSHPKTAQFAKAWAGQKRLLPVSHFFWYGGTTIQKSQEGLLRTLLFQILINYPEITRNLFPKRYGDSFRYLESWSLEELSAAFEALRELPDLPFCILIFVDGLDEYVGEKKGLTKFLHAVAEPPNIKVCCASRPWPEFHKAFGRSSAQVEMHNLTRDDMRLYVRDELQKDKLFREIQSSGDSQALALIDSISERAEGVFFWVFLVVKSLLKGLSYNDNLECLQKRILEFPKDLETFFQRMVDSIDGVHRQRVHDVFAALLMAKSPLPLVFFLAQEKLEVLRQNWAENSKSKMWQTKGHRVVESIAAGIEGGKRGWKFRGTRGSAYYRDEINFEDNLNQRRLESIPSSESMHEYKDTLLWQCCDLVQAWDTYGTSPREHEQIPTASEGRKLDLYRIGFLHRTVIEFLQQSNQSLSSAVELPGYPRYIYARSFLEITPSDLRPTVIANQFILRFIHAIQETKSHIGRWADDGYQLLDLCNNIRKRMFDDLVGEWRPTLKLLSSVQALIIVQKHEWESSDTVHETQRFIHLYENENSAEILADILEGASIIEVGDYATSTPTNTIDLDLLERLLCLRGFNKHITPGTHTSVWGSFVAKLCVDEHFQPRNAFEACQILIRHGAARKMGFPDVIAAFREHSVFYGQEVAALEDLFPRETIARKTTSALKAKRKNRRKGKGIQFLAAEDRSEI